MDRTEAALELLLNKLSELIESGISNMSYREISTMSQEIPRYRDLNDLRKARDDFLNRFNSPMKMPSSLSYTDSLLKNIDIDEDFSADVKSQLKAFFVDENKRILRIRGIIQNRCQNPKYFTKTPMQFSNIERDIARHLFMCKEGIMRTECNEQLTLTAQELMFEVTSKFFKRKRTSLLKSILFKIRRFPLTRQHKILSDMFDRVRDDYVYDISKFPIPILSNDEMVINDELKRLADKFKVPFNFNSSDGQMFFFVCQKKFEEIYKELDFYNLPTKECEFKQIDFPVNLNYLIQRSLVKEVPQHVKLAAVFKSIFQLSMDEIRYKISLSAEEYNSLVGNEHRTYGFRGNFSRRSIPVFKIITWLELRFMHIKFLATAILSHINYFMLICLQLEKDDSNKDNLELTDFQVRNSKFKQILELVDNNQKPFIFSKAFEYYDIIIDSFISIGSYYVSKFEDKASERSGDDAVSVDYEAVVESLLQYELDYLNAKRHIIQSLMECLEHKKSKKLKQIIYNIIVQKPNLNFQMFQSFEIPYKLAIQIMYKKAEIVRTLINLQILHERYLAAKFGNEIPLYDRPSEIPIDIKYRYYDESIPISPFEVYESLIDINKIYEVVPHLIKEIGESVNLKLLKHEDYLEYSIWNEIGELIKTMTATGLIPYDRSTTKFEFKLSRLLKSLFISPYINDLNKLKEIITSNAEYRQYRFLLSVRRFFKITWKLQSLIIDYDLLLSAYYSQFDYLGISDKGFGMSPFKEYATKEIIDLETEEFDDHLLDFALSEFETVSLDFEQESMIKDIIFAADFSVLKRMVKFQKMQNFILESVIRFNRHIVDSSFLVSYFELGKDSETFLTGVTVPDKEQMNERYIKQMVAMRLFYESTTIYRNNEIALENKDKLYASIKTIKSKSRTILSAHVKQKEMTPDQVFDLYLTDMIEQFSAYGYRAEIVRVCDLERQILLSNTFVDTYVLGPDPLNCLINAQGHFEKFFYNPSWYEASLMISDAPHARQKMILKALLSFVSSRLRILNFVRFESSLQQRLNIVFDSIYNQCYQCDSPILQKLYNELMVLPNARDVEIAAKHIAEKERFLYYRIEFAILVSLEKFFVSVISSESFNVKPSDPLLGKNLQLLWIQMHQPFNCHKDFINESRYIPYWTEQFVYKCFESDREDIGTQLYTNDTFLDTALASAYNIEILENSVQKLPRSIDFLSLMISQYQIKFAYFLLLEDISENEINITYATTQINEDIYKKYSKIWEGTIIKQANENLVPKEESPSRALGIVPETKLAQTIFDVIRNQIDVILVSNQIKQTQFYINDFERLISHVKTIASSTKKINFGNDLPIPSSIPSGMKENALNKEESSASNKPIPLILIQDPQSIDDQFVQELSYSQKRIIEKFFKLLKQCSVICKDEEGKDEFTIDSTSLDDSLIKLSTLINFFMGGSLENENDTWKKYLMNVIVAINQDQEENDAVSILAKHSFRRNLKRIDSDSGYYFYPLYLKYNQLIQTIHDNKQKKNHFDTVMIKKTKEYYQKLIDDIVSAAEALREQHSGDKRIIFNNIMKRIKSAKTVKLEMKEKQSNDPAHPGSYSLHFASKLDYDFLKKIDEENNAIRKQILKIRCIKCLSEIGIRRKAEKLQNESEKLRKAENIQFWDTKLKSTDVEVNYADSLLEKNLELNAKTAEIEELRKKLDNERLHNIELVHWKAANVKTVDNLKDKINSFGESIYDYNITNLVQQLEAAQTELESLRENAKALETEKINEIYVPMIEAEKIRAKVRSSKNEKSILLSTIADKAFHEEQAIKENFVQHLSDENIELRLSNEQLKEKIAEYEKQKQMKSERAKSLMEEALQSRNMPLRFGTRTTGRIVKPFPKGAPRSFSRI